MLNLDLTTGKLFHPQRVWVPDKLCEIDRSKPLGAEQIIDPKVTREVKHRKITLQLRMDSAHHEIHAMSFGNGGTDKIHRILAGESEEKVTLRDVGPAEGFNRAAVSTDHLRVDNSFHFRYQLRIRVNHCDAVGLAELFALGPEKSKTLRKLYGQVPANLSGSDDDYVHMNNLLTGLHFLPTFVACEQNRAKRNVFINYQYFTMKCIRPLGSPASHLRGITRDPISLSTHERRSVLPSETM